MIVGFDTLLAPGAGIRASTATQCGADRSQLADVTAKSCIHVTEMRRRRLSTAFLRLIAGKRLQRHLRRLTRVRFPVALPKAIR